MNKNSDEVVTSWLFLGCILIVVTVVALTHYYVGSWASLLVVLFFISSFRRI